jgi:WD40 repeat protein/mono/diheme cytochrome c family protein
MGQTEPADGCSSGIIDPPRLHPPHSPRHWRVIRSHGSDHKPCENNMFHRSLRFAAGFCLSFALTHLATAAEESAEATPLSEVSYFRDVRPIFQRNCHGCHQPAKAGGEFVMTDFEKMLAGGESENAAIVAGDVSQSELLEMITPVDGKAKMPQNADPLATAEIDTIRKWIEQGAKNDAPAATRTTYDAEHPPEYVLPPVVTSLDFSPDGQFLAVSGYHEVLIYRTADWQLDSRLIGLSERIESAVFSPSGEQLAVTGGSPGRMGEIQLWNFAERSLVFSKTVGYDTIYGVSWSPDAKLLAFGCPDKTLRAISVETTEEVLFNGAHNGWVLDTVFSVKGDHLISVGRDRSMKLVNVPTQRFIDNVTSITPGALKGGLNAVDRHPDKDEVLAGGADGAPKIYRMFREKARKIGDDFNLIRAFPAMPGRIFAVDFDKKGDRFVAGSSLNGIGEVAVYEVADGKQLAKTPIADGGIYAVAYDPQGRWVAAGGFSGKIRVIKVDDGSVMHEFTVVPTKASLPAATATTTAAAP